MIGYRVWTRCLVPRMKGLRPAWTGWASEPIKDAYPTEDAAREAIEAEQTTLIIDGIDPRDVSFLVLPINLSPVIPREVRRGPG